MRAATLRAIRLQVRFMARITRREFLGMSAATAGAAAIGHLPPALRRALAVAPGGGSVSSIKHVVVLMQENRSFDHYFGSLGGVRGFGDRAAARSSDGRSVFEQFDPKSGSTIVPRRADGADVADLDHGWEGTHRAWNQGNYDCWVEAKGVGSMGYLTRADIPFHYALADAFTLCDNYFCSVMGPTNPNRLYLWTGTIDPQGVAGGPVIDNRSSGFRWTTYPERLQAAGVSWKVYQNAADNFDDNALAWFAQFRDAAPGSPLYDRGMGSVPARTGTTGGDIVAAIRDDVLGGTLPLVSWIVPPEECSEHPSCSPAAGAQFIARLLEALTADADVWASTVLLINYDENDGFFDHVPPPVPHAGTPEEFVAGLPIGLGPRVPMFVVSPWSRGGYVCPQVFDHTSVIRLIEVVTGVREPNISPWRRAVCGDLTSAFDFTTRVFPPPSRDPWLSAPTQAGSAGIVPIQEAGERPVRSSPCRPEALAHLDSVNGTVRVELSNSGSESVHFAIRVAGESCPRHYDVAAYGVVQHSFAISGTRWDFDITVYGVSGPMRASTGSIEHDGTGVRTFSLLTTTRTRAVA
jgi:phospholipase C